MGRRGGKSVGPYAGLNVSYRVGDDSKVVSQNVCDMKLAVGIHEGRIVTMRQVHGDSIVEVKDKRLKEAGEADGMITAEPGIYLGVLTADCVPLLFIAPKQRLAAAVHAGWRGTAQGIAGKTVADLAAAAGGSARDIVAAIGPAIGPCCYEVGPEVRAAFQARTARLTARAWSRRRDRDVIDLRLAVTEILVAAGVARVTSIGPCTRCSPDHCSFRRDGAAAGRQASVIGWR
jgi:YfiH family protein